MKTLEVLFWFGVFTIMGVTIGYGAARIKRPSVVIRHDTVTVDRTPAWWDSTWVCVGYRPDIGIEEMRERVRRP